MCDSPASTSAAAAIGTSSTDVWGKSSPSFKYNKFTYKRVAMAETDSDSASPHSHSQHSHSHSAASTTSAGGGGNRMTFVQSAIGYHSLWLKLFVLFLYLFFSGLSNWAVLSYTHDIIPRDPLPDILFRLIPEQKWASFWGDMMVTACLIQLILMIVFHSFRSVILRRALFILATLYLMRSAVLLATQLPSGYTNNTVMCREQLNHSGPSVFFSRLFEQTIRLGFQEKSGMLCGDLLFSGHTLVMIICSLTIGYYIPRPIRALQWVVHACAAFGMLCLIISRTHYTIDILIAYWLSCFVFRSYHAYCEVDLCMERRRSCLSGFLFSHAVDWIESDIVPGRIENRLSIPFKDLLEKDAESRGHHKQVSLSSSSSLAFS